MIFSPHSYQRNALQFLLERPHGALFADPGLGKTAIALAAIRAHAAAGTAPRWLVVAPLRVAANTWPEEIHKWDQFQDLTFSVFHGSSARLDPEAVITLVNPEGLPKLFTALGTKSFFDGLIVDESTKFKNWIAKRTKLLRKRAKGFRFRYLLTGTPSPNGYLDLFAQTYLMDLGEAFGKSITKYKEQYFEPTDFRRFNWRLKDGADKKIERKIAPYVLRLNAEELLDLPPFVYQDIKVTLPAKARKHYDEIESELFTEIDGSEILSRNSAAKYSHCRQVASGAVYNEGLLVRVHNEKIEALADFRSELQKSLLVAYNYVHEKDRLIDFFGDDATWIGGGVSAKESSDRIKQWQSGRKQILFAQCSSISHGLNLQYGSCRHIVWFSLTDNLETYLQFNRRIRRQGVDSAVFVHHIVARDTVDVMLKRLVAKKDITQTSLLEALAEYRGSSCQ